VFGWLSRRDKSPGTPAIDAAEGLIAEGNRAEDAGDAARARELYRQAVAAAPQLAAAHLNLGIALEGAGDMAAARAAYERALELEPAGAAAHYNLGKLLYGQGAMAQAQAHLAHALAARPDFPQARLVHGYALHALGRLHEAVLELRAGLAARPDDVHARATLFHILDAQGDAAAALVELESVLKLRPDWTQALYNYGTTLKSLRREAEAEAALRRVLERDPAFVLAYRMLGSLFHRQGRIEETLALCAAGRKALPESRDIESFELFALNFSDRVADDELFSRHVAFGTRLEASVPPRFTFRAAAKRTLRIGYVSADLSYHPVGLFMLPVLERHDRARFEAYCYATGPQVDDLTRRLRAAAGAWREAHALSDTALADLVHADGVDILVDLAGHSGVSRLGVFAQKPAPVQAAWLGYLNTTGLRRIDYRITDRYCDPEGATDGRHTETLVRLPHSQWCYRPFVDVAPASQAPLERNGAVTFGAFTQTAKLSPTTLGLWARILRESPAARLLIAGVVAAERMHIALEQAHIERSRVELVPFLPVKEYLRLFDRIDIGLDPLPYSGGTSTCDALWMGVPVITLPGARPASRSAASILTTLGLDDWIARDGDDYVRRAVRFAKDARAVTTLRQTLRGRMQASPLTDEQGFTRALEETFESMWRRR
jgi:predicted O-linked N-acetylglucosamine transferase (SPINDLY family)